MSPIDVQWDESQPIYRQLRDRVVAMMLEGALKEGLKHKGLVFLDFITDQTENVYPMIAAGKGQNEMHLSPCSAGVAPTDRELA